MRRGTSWLALLLCLVVAGLIRAAIPDYIPEEYVIEADDSATARMDEVTVQLLDVWAAEAVHSVSDWTETVLETEHVFLLARVDITPHLRSYITRAELRTTDGHTYDFLQVNGFTGTSVTHVGSTYTTTLIFEVPRDKAPGAHLAIRGQSTDGLQPVMPVLRFDLEDPDVVTDLTPPADVARPVR